MMRYAPLIIVLFVGCTGIVAQRDLSAMLTSGKWIKDLGSGPEHEEYVYTFAKDGTYTSKLITDHGTPTIKGRWELVEDKAGKVHLQLSDQVGQDKYYWLGQDSVIRYDKGNDELFVSGERYVGEQRLRHEKL